VGQRSEALLDRIGAGALLTEPIRVFVNSGFRNGIEREQMQRLLRSIDHCGAHRFAIRLRYIRHVETGLIVSSVRLTAPSLSVAPEAGQRATRRSSPRADLGRINPR
jgi:hypothetical protein